MAPAPQKRGNMSAPPRDAAEVRPEVSCHSGAVHRTRDGWSRGTGGPSRRFMLVGDVYAPVDDGLASSGYRYEQYTQLAGPLRHVRRDQPYQVQYRSIHTSRREWIIIRVIALALVALDIRFMYWL